MLAEYHRDLFADFFRDKLTGDELLGFIDHLPRRSRFGAAMAEDDELAEMVEGVEAPEGSAIQFGEWSPEVQYLADLIDRVNTLISIVATAAGGGRVEPPQAERPTSAADRLRKRREDEYFASLEADIADAQRFWAEENGEGV